MRSSFRALVLLACLGFGSALAPTPAFAQLTFVQIAREFGGGLHWFDPNFRPAIADDGSVVFAGGHAPTAYNATRIFVGNGGPLRAADFGAAGLSELGALSIHAKGGVAFTAKRVTWGRLGTYRGVYTLTFDRRGAPTFSTLYEGALVANPAPRTPWPVRHDLAMSQDGTIAFSTILNGGGALYRSPFAGPPAALRTGSGTFYNTQYLDVNDAGQVVAQMEYADPTQGLTRGFLIFETPQQTLAGTDTALERLGIAAQPVPSIHAAGDVAFVTNGTLTMRFFDPPGVFGPVYEDVVITPGVWVVSPAPWGIAKYPVRIAGPQDGFTSFWRVDINDAGQVAFQAGANGETGVFVGPDPIADKVLATGDVRGNQLYSVVSLGGLNNAGEIALWTSDWYSTDRQVWRVENAFGP